MQWQDFTQTFSTAVGREHGPGGEQRRRDAGLPVRKAGKIAYADDLLESWRSNGIYDDFLPGVLDAMKTPKGYVAIPYNLDMRVLWYSKSLLAEGGGPAPTDWQSPWTLRRLKRIGVYGFGLSGDAQAATPSRRSSAA